MQESTSSTSAVDPYLTEQKTVATGVTDGSRGWRKRQIIEWLEAGEIAFSELEEILEKSNGKDKQQS